MSDKGGNVIKRVLFGVALSVAVVGGAQALTTEPQPLGDPARCAALLGIEWTWEDGATERLDDFEACMGGGVATSDSDVWSCWVEPSNTPEGFEVIAKRLHAVQPVEFGFEVPCPR